MWFKLGIVDGGSSLLIVLSISWLLSTAMDWRYIYQYTTSDGWPTVRIVQRGNESGQASGKPTVTPSQIVGNVRICGGTPRTILFAAKSPHSSFLPGPLAATFINVIG
jgi:hypothetical protein